MSMFSSSEDQKAFELWAFGQYPVTYGLSALHSWNSRHGELYFAFSHHRVQDSVSYMVALYRVEQEKKRLIDEETQRLNRIIEHAQEKGSLSYIDNAFNTMKRKYGQKDAPSHKANEDGRKGRETGQEGRCCQSSQECGKAQREACKDRQGSTRPACGEGRKDGEKGDEKMSVYQTCCEFIAREKSNKIERTVFEAAMTEKIQKEGYKMSDLIYELYCVQRDLELLTKKYTNLEERVSDLED